MKSLTPKGATIALNGYTAKMYRIHRAIMTTSFEAINVYRRQGDLEMAEKFRQTCLRNFYQMKEYEVKLVKGVR